MDKIIVVINPGSTSTKTALFQGKERIAEEAVYHPAEEPAAFDDVADQSDLHRKNIDRRLAG